MTRRDSKQVHLLVEEVEQAQWQRRREQNVRRKVLESQAGEWRWQVQEDGRRGGRGRQQSHSRETMDRINEVYNAGIMNKELRLRRQRRRRPWEKAHSPCPARQLSRYSDASRPCFVVRISYTSNGGSSPRFLALFQRSSRVIPRLGP